MSNELKIVRVSDKARQLELPEVPPISEKGLQVLEEVMRKGLVLESFLGIKSHERAAPLHIHPKTILALIQEVRRARQGGLSNDHCAKSSL